MVENLSEWSKKAGVGEWYVMIRIYSVSERTCVGLVLLYCSNLAQVCICS